jgi:hypothetical protein
MRNTPYVTTAAPDHRRHDRQAVSAALRLLRPTRHPPCPSVTSHLLPLAPFYDYISHYN